MKEGKGSDWYKRIREVQKCQRARGKTWNVECLKMRLRVPLGKPPWSDSLYFPFILEQREDSQSLLGFFRR